MSILFHIHFKVKVVITFPDRLVCRSSKLTKKVSAGYWTNMTSWCTPPLSLLA